MAKEKIELSSSKFSLLISAILAGLGLSIYSVYHHFQITKFGNFDSFCSINQTFDCGAVAQSPYSVMFGVPLGVWGGLYFCTQLFFIFPRFKNNLSKQNAQNFLGLAILGVLASLYLAFVSLFLIKAVCLVCVSTYFVILVMFIGSFSWKKFLDDFDFTKNIRACMVPLLLVLVTLPTYFFYASSVKSAPAPKENMAQTNPSETLEGKELMLSPKAKEIPLSKSPYKDLGEDYRRGNESASIVIQKFSDFQCPACKGMAQSLHQIVDKFSNDVQIVYRNFPLDNACNYTMKSPMHPHSCFAAVLARCAGQHGMFWKFHDFAFENQGILSKPMLLDFMQTLGLDKKEVDSCLANPSIKEKIKDDIKLGEALGLDATPTVFLNGRKFFGSNVEDLEKAIKELLDARGV